MVYRPQNNPRSASSDRVPPELEVLGLHDFLCRTGLSGCPYRFDHRFDQSICRESVGVWLNSVSTHRTGILLVLLKIESSK